MRKKGLIFLTISFLCLFSQLLLNVKTVKAASHEKIIGKEFDLRTEITLNDTLYQAVSTANYFYLIHDGQIEKQISIIGSANHVVVIGDINQNSHDDFIIMTTSNISDNILVYDSKDYSVIYSLRSTMRTFDEGLGYIEEIVAVNDYVIDGNKGVFIAGYNVFLVDLFTGKVKWNYEAKNNLYDIVTIGDSNNDNISDYAVSLQTTNVIALSGSNGKELFDIAVSESVTFKMKTYETSIWSLEYDDEMKSLYACSENGKLYVIDSKSGTIKSSKQVFQLTIEDVDDFYKKSAYFKQLSIDLVEDIDGDGVKDILYRQLTSEEIRQNNLRTLRKAKPAILFLSGKDLSELPGRIDLEIFNEKYYFRGVYNNLDVYYIYGTYTTQSVFKIFSIKDNRYLDEVFVVEHDTFMNYTGEGYLMFKHNETKTVFIGQVGLSYLTNSIVTDFIPLARESYFIENGDHLLMVHGNFSLSLRNIEDASEIWNFQLDQTSLVNNVRFYEVHYSLDYTNDGIDDIVVVMGGGTKTLPSVLLIDGENGVILNQVEIGMPEEDLLFPFTMATPKQIYNVNNYNDFLSLYDYYGVELKASGLYSDINSDGFKEVYVINEYGDIYFLDVINESLVNYYTNNKEIVFSNNHYTNINFCVNGNPAILITDVSGDTYSDFYQVIFDKSPELYRDEYDLFRVMVTPTSVIHDNSSELPGMFAEEYIYIGDINYDGIPEYGVPLYRNSKYRLHIISSKTGREIINVEAGLKDHFYVSNIDINNDHLKEIFRVSETYSLHGKLQLIDISSSVARNLFVLEDYLINYDDMLSKSEPANTFIKDGKIYIALNISDNYGEEIIIYDYSTKMAVENIEVEKILDPTNKQFGSINIYQDGDVIYFYSTSGNDDNYISKDYKISSVRSNVYDYTNKRIYFFYNNNQFNQLIIKDNLIYIKNIYGEVFTKVMSEPLQIAELENEQVIGGNYRLKFINKLPGMVYVYVDNILVGVTDQVYFDLQLLEGKHDLSITQVDVSGIALISSVTIVVEQNNFLNSAIIVSTIILFVGTFIVLRRRKVQLINKGSGGK